MTQHGPPMQPGIGSLDVTIGYQPAWRALPAKVGAAVAKASEAVKALMDEPVLTPASAGSKLGKITKGLGQSAGKAAGKGNSSAVSASASAVPAMMSTNVALTATWTSASPVPGGQPAANQAYTLGIKAAAAAASSAVFAAIGGMADTHICPIPVPVPPHGPGMVCAGSETVFINNLPASRKDDKIMEAAGGADAISKGCATVIIGDNKGSGGGGGKAGKGKSGTEAGKAGDATGLTSEKSTEQEPGKTVTIPAVSVVCECTNPNCSGAFEDAAENGTPLVERDTYGCGGPPVEVVDTGEHTIEFELLGDDGKGVPNEPYLLTLPNGQEQQGRLGQDGSARIEGITDPGDCKISFPERDERAVEAD